jgi:preprotein translocase subunit SecF
VSDLIGKRRYGYLLSAILISTGLIFILLTFVPNGNMGLQFSIAYTGGTLWEVHFEDGLPDPADVRVILDEQGLTGSEVAITGTGDREYVLIRTEALALIEPESGSDAVTDAEASTAPDASASPGASASPDASAEPDASASPDASAEPDASAPTATAAASVEPEATEAPSAAPVESVTPGASGAPSVSTAPSASREPDAPPDLDAAVAVIANTDEGGPVAGVPTEGEFGELAAALQEEFGRIDEVRQQNSVGPVVSAELIQQTFLLIVFAAFAIMVWVTYRFRDYRMGITAIVALVHDVIIVVGLFAVLGTLTGLRVDALFVTAMLTVIGYSVHDTIVVFDRVRENRQRFLGEPLERIVNHSIMQTLGRSFTTSLTLVLTLAALLLFAGDAIRPFTFALLVGVVAGTYSSIFVATPLFLDWHLFDDRRKARAASQAEASPA